MVTITTHLNNIKALLPVIYIHYAGYLANMFTFEDGQIKVRQVLLLDVVD
jgi:hypothetical protein